MNTSSTATGSGSNVSSGVWLPKGSTLKGIMLIYSSVFNKKNYITSVSLLFRHTLYIGDVTGKCSSAFSLVLFNNTENSTKENTALSYACHCQYCVCVCVYVYIMNFDGNTNFNSLLYCSMCS